ncbi:aurora kinase [Perkinsela sp. CCAP 1560/4]|nr:aurora kinase [Perkinsela sp. CCAP 1560/4]|eukprot:KNH09341.1 aurora kinase [Perkinsela sp. CCAP 1560/4]
MLTSSPNIEKSDRLTAHESSFFDHSTITPFRSCTQTPISQADSHHDVQALSLRKRSSHGDKQGFFDLFELCQRIPKIPGDKANKKEELHHFPRSKSKLGSIARSDIDRARMTECFTLCTMPIDAGEISKRHAKSLCANNVDTVWLASYRSTGKLFAVKFLWSPSRSQSSRYALTRQAIQSQVDIHKKMKHPYIARLSGFLKNIPIGEDPKVHACALITEYVPCGTLEDQLLSRQQSSKERKFSDLEARHIISQLCSALRYMHNTHRAVHCDVKLANILYDTDKRQIKLIDFGLALDLGKEKNCNARRTESEFNDKQLLRRGTLNYLSPEQVQGTVQNSNLSKVDVWALGVCACELVTGVSPFERDSELRTRQAIAEGAIQPEAAAQISRLACVKSFIGACFELDPQKRPSVDVLMKHLWLNSKLTSS